MTAAKLDLTAVVSAAKDLHAAQHIDRVASGEPGQSGWDELPDWMKLSWFCEAAAELGMEL